jgi:hypothetical protein
VVFVPLGYKLKKKGNKMIISQLANNQFVINTNNGVYFQSYKSVVAHISRDGTITLGDDWDYSRTTKKYLSRFLEMPYKDIVKDFETKKISFDQNLTIESSLDDS